jgi:hypothetical protein
MRSLGMLMHLKELTSEQTAVAWVRVTNIIYIHSDSGLHFKSLTIVNYTSSSLAKVLITIIRCL